MTHAKGERADCFKMYLKPIMGRSNLTVLTDAKTLRVETEEAAGTTVTRGVTFQQGGQDGEKLQGRECALLQNVQATFGYDPLVAGRWEGAAPNNCQRFPDVS